jgi:hypothetical protein
MPMNKRTFPFLNSSYIQQCKKGARTKKEVGIKDRILAEGSRCGAKHK